MCANGHLQTFRVSANESLRTFEGGLVDFQAGLEILQTVY